MQNTTQEVIGIIGDGQLALMLAESLTKFGLPFCCLSEQNDSPMMRLFPKETTNDKEVFQRSCSVFTLENEFLTVAELEYLLKEKIHDLFPQLSSYRFFADKLAQRRLYQELNLNSPKWMLISPEINENVVLKNFSFPFVLKASQGGYDGKGVRIINNENDFEEGLKDFGHADGRSLLIEEKVSIKRELAQGFVHNKNGFTLLPLVDTIQESGVCNFVYYPAEVSDKVQSQIENMLHKLIHYPLIGIFNFEFFVDMEDRVFINEGAPRPHNSQHLTIDASNYSQFDLLALYLHGRKDLPSKIETKRSAMVNILGKSTAVNYKLTLPAIDEKLSIHTKLYGKSKSIPGRKMGHVNIVDESGQNDLREFAEKIFKEYEI